MANRIRMQRHNSKTYESRGLLGATGRTNHGGTAGHRSISGVTLIELLCVLVIIGILASLLMPTVARVYSRVRGLAEDIEGPEIVQMLLQETRGYCAGTPRYRFDSKSDFADKCGLSPKCRTWVQATATEFVPFSYLDPTNKIVLVFHTGRNRATRYAFNVAELSPGP